MMWYNKYLKKIAFRNKIDVLTNQIVRFIHQKLMNLFKKNGQFPDVYWLPTGKFPLLRELGVSKIELNFNEDDKIENFAFLDAITHFSKSYSFQRISEIEIPILWNPNNFNNTSWSQIYFELIEIIRHELEHASQYTYNKRFEPYRLKDIKKGKDNIKNIRKAYIYLSNKMEIDAFIRGIVLKAKKQKKDALKIYENYIINQFFWLDKDEDFKSIEMLMQDLNDVIIIDGMTVYECFIDLVKKFKERAKEMQLNFRRKS